MKSEENKKQVSFKPELNTKPFRYDRNVLPYRQPFGGWYYKIPKGPTIYGKSHKDLVKSLIKYKLSNGIRLGNPNYEIEQYICMKNLHLMQFGESEYLKDEDLDPFMDYIQKIKVEKKERASIQAIINRKKTCYLCHHNRKLRKGIPYDREAFLVAGERDRKGLFQCSKHMWDNMVAPMLKESSCDKWV